VNYYIEIELFNFIEIYIKGMIIKFLENNFEYIITLSIIIFTLLVIFSIYGIKFDFNREFSFSDLPNRVMKIETFINNLDSLPNNDEFEVDFCNKYKDDHQRLNRLCKGFDKNSCNSTGCCVWVKEKNGEKCFAGDRDGPHYKSEKNNPLEIAYYFFKNKCFSGKEKCLQ
jgi:hypothetical protein